MHEQIRQWKVCLAHQSVNGCAVCFSSSFILLLCVWQREWQRHPENKFYKIQPKVDDLILSLEWQRHPENKFYKIQPKVDDPILSLEWQRHPENKFCKIQPKVDDPIPRKVLCRLHIGHTFLTHFYLLKGEEPPICIPCGQLCSVEHLLTERVDLTEWRRQFFTTEPLKMFCECSPANIVQFLKQTNLVDALW